MILKPGAGLLFRLLLLLSLTPGGVNALSFKDLLISFDTCFKIRSWENDTKKE